MAEYVSATLPIIKKQLFATALGLMTMYIVAETDYRFFVRLGTGCLSLIYGTFYSSFICRTGNQWLQKVAEFWTVVFSTFGICKSSRILFLTWQIQGSKRLQLASGLCAGQC